MFSFSQRTPRSFLCDPHTSGMTCLDFKLLCDVGALPEGTALLYFILVVIYQCPWRRKSRCLMVMMSEPKASVMLLMGVVSCQTLYPLFFSLFNL